MGCTPLLQCLGQGSLPSSAVKWDQLLGWVIITNGDGDVEMVAVYQWTHSPSWLAWSEGRQPSGAESAFIKWTGWMLAMALSYDDRQHQKHCRDIIIITFCNCEKLQQEQLHQLCRQSRHWYDAVGQQKRAQCSATLCHSKSWVSEKVP